MSRSPGPSDLIELTIELHQHGPRPRRGRPTDTLLEQVTDRDDHFLGLLHRVYDKGRTPTLDRIDPYARVIMSVEDCGRLLAELPSLAAVATSDAERHILRSVEHLARRCAASSDNHYLYVEGQ